MLPASPSSILVLALLQAPPAPESPPPASGCEAVQRVELSLSTASFEVCISPGLMTGFRFDAPVTVDLQVEVYRDKRTRESFQQELEQERAKSQQLREEVQQLRGQVQELQARLNQSSGLMGLHLSGVIGQSGIQSRVLRRGQPIAGGLSMSRGTSFRAEDSVAVEMWLLNSSAEPWTAVGASLVTAKGERLEGVRLYQPEAIPPNEARRVFVEVPAKRGEAQGRFTLNLWEAGPRTLSIPKVTFP